MMTAGVSFALRSLAAVQGPDLSTRLQLFFLYPHLFGSLALGHFLKLGEVGRRSVTESHRAGIVELIELDLEVASVPARLRFVRVGMNHSDSECRTILWMCVGMNASWMSWC